MKIKWKCLLGAIGAVCVGLPLLLATIFGAGYGVGWLLGFREPIIGTFIVLGIGLITLFYFVCADEN